MRTKVTVIGAGNVGATTAQRLAERGYADVVLVDIVDGLPQGKALDMYEASPVIGVDSCITGATDYGPTAGSDIIVITSGVARKPGMSRDDLLQINMGIVDSVTRAAITESPDATIVVVSNPLDAMCHVAYDAAGIPSSRVVGMAGILDTARYRSFLSEAINISVEDINAFVLGGHGDTMVPLASYTTAAGIPITKLLPQDQLDQIIQRTRDGGAEIVNLLKTGSAFYAPSAAVAQMVDAIALDKRRILPCAALLNGEYGVDGLFIGVPVVLGRNGIEQILEINLTDEEQAQLQHSADAVQGLVDDMARLGAN
ncbi:MAG: malate dehydrogenase [Chloroflexi bacterium]|nr:malate dehydrogenase [Chloroflexota bacterium]MYB21971.1 malate dehydrogenase [Chloroflexota bacterium]MYF21985.1 malate dehydrogenase [Chloroflexota bacterium]MYF82196.1 malate dehydrogenase [Chloroflexota bacterium]MYI04837.1 malate dehydrogenase [Chloroflexota bacterium]